jgi:hypothetical protein
VRAFLALGLATLAWATPAQGATGVVWGVNDDNARLAWAAMKPKLAPLQARDPGFQLAIAVNWRLPSLGRIPPSQPVLVTLTGSQSLGPADAPLSDAMQVAYADAALALVEAHPNVREIVVWNELDDATWPGSMGQYVRLLIRVHDTLAGRALVLGGPAHPDALLPPFPAWLNRVNMATFLAAVRHAYYPAGAWRSILDGVPVRSAPLMDGLAYHPYSRWNAACTQLIASEVSSALADLPQPRPPFWWTETGMWSSGKHWGSPPMVGTPAEQAKRIGAIAHVAISSKLVAADFNFLLADAPGGQDGSGPAIWAWKSGLYYQDGTPKPALAAFETASG